jgi:hypothetical protein
MVDSIPYAYATPVHSYNTINMAAYPTTSPFDVPTGKGALMTTQRAHVAYYADDTGFTGPIMGGSAPTTSTAWDQRNDSNCTSDTHNSKSWIQKAGTNISAVAQKTGSSASAAASKTTSKIASAATSTGSFLSRGLKNSSISQSQPQQQVYTVQTTTEYGNSSVVAQKTGSTASADASKTTSNTSSTSKTGSFFSRGLKNSSIGHTQPQQQVYTVTTTQTGGGSSTTPMGGDSSTTRTVVTTQGGRSGRERVAGSVGTYATYSMAMNAMSGNIVGVIRSGAVAAGAFAIEGNAAEQRNQQSNYREK